MFRKCYEVVAYSADADIICPECAVKLYGVKHDTYLPELDGIEDNEGNPVHPVFLEDDFFRFAWTGVKPVCGNCWDELDV